MGHNKNRYSVTLLNRSQLMVTDTSSTKGFHLQCSHRSQSLFLFQIYQLTLARFPVLCYIRPKVFNYRKFLAGINKVSDTKNIDLHRQLNAYTEETFSFQINYCGSVRIELEDNSVRDRIK